LTYEPQLLGFLCNWCSYAGADLAGVSRIQYAPNLRVIRVMCSGRVDPVFILEAFLKGVDGVLVLGCHLGDCHYISGNYEAVIKMELLDKILGFSGFSERLRLDWVSASEGNRFAQVVNEFTEKVRNLGPSPIKDKNQKAEITDELKAIKSALSDIRLRALVARKRSITTEGNVYEEIVPEEEYNKLLEQAINDEYLRHKILVKIKNKGKSVPEISKEINVKPNKVLEHIVYLKSRGLVDFDIINDIIPTFISIQED